MLTRVSCTCVMRPSLPASYHLPFCMWQSSRCSSSFHGAWRKVPLKSAWTSSKTSIQAALRIHAHTDCAHCSSLAMSEKPCVELCSCFWSVLVLNWGSNSSTAVAQLSTRNTPPSRKTHTACDPAFMPIAPCCCPRKQTSGIDKPKEMQMQPAAKYISARNLFVQDFFAEAMAHGHGDNQDVIPAGERQSLMTQANRAFAELSPLEQERYRQRAVQHQAAVQQQRKADVEASQSLLDLHGARLASQLRNDGLRNILSEVTTRDRLLPKIEDILETRKPSLQQCTAVVQEALQSPSCLTAAQQDSLLNFEDSLGRPALPVRPKGLYQQGWLHCLHLSGEARRQDRDALPLHLSEAEPQRDGLGRARSPAFAWQFLLGQALECGLVGSMGSGGLRVAEASDLPSGHH